MSGHQLLVSTLEKYLDEKEWSWLSKKIAVLSGDFKDRNFYLAFSACSRFVDKLEISFDTADKKLLNAYYPNFSDLSWPKDELARITLITALPVDSNQRLLDNLFATADYRELIALYKGLYFLDNANDFALRCREGLRTNMAGVFDSIALYNPFPAKYLTEDAWNHMVLKAVFMERPIYKVHQIEERKNKNLAYIFLDYAHERMSAHRKVTPELWRFVAGYADENFSADLQRTVLEGAELERVAAIKALVESDFSKGHQWLKAQRIETDQLPSWDEIGKALAE
ncbi:MAG: EboA domain-containing protein [Bacteroidota bacterium]